MNSITIDKINDKLKTLPDNCEEDILAYISFLNFKYNEEDWASDLSEQELLQIKKGESDVRNGKIYSHEDAMKRINFYLETKRK